MKKTLFPIAVITLFAFSGTVFALPIISSADDQVFKVNESSQQLRDITITEDPSTSYITAGTIELTIPSSLEIIFDSERTGDYLVLSGTAVDNGKIAAHPAITYENSDKTIIFPVDADFALGEEVVISGIQVEGFHRSPGSADYLIMTLNGDTTEYQNTKSINIETSGYTDSYEPDLPTNIQIGDHANGVQLTWNDPTDLDLTAIQILRGKNGAPISGTPYAEIGPGLEEYIDNNVSEGETVKYIFRTTDGENLSELSEEFEFVAGSGVPGSNLLPPQDITVELTEQGAIVLNWTIQEYAVQIFKKTNDEDYSGDYFTQVESTTAQYTDESVEAGNTYAYKLRTYNNESNSGFSEEFSVEIPGGEEDAGEEEEIYCTADYAPVCGVDSETYANECTATKEGVEIDYEGECELEVEDVIEDSFSDISEHWAKQDIEKMAAQGVIAGYDDGTFRPNNNLNRAEAAVILYQIITDLDPNDPSVKPFSDVEVDAWFAGYVNELKTLEIVNGNPDGTYSPGNNINRAEFLALAMNTWFFLMENAGNEPTPIEDYEITDQFSDLSAGAWYAKVVSSAYEHGFVNGFDCEDEKCFAASREITRAEAVVILNNMFPVVELDEE